MTARKVNSFYQRTLADLPIFGKAVSLQVHLRKFFCGNPNCPRKIFAQTSSDDFRHYTPDQPPDSGL
jgi:hypothetical protein